MRACEGCRRRKIKCDAATTNTWPCSACIRLKLQCNPPTVNYDQEFSQDGMGMSAESSLSSEALSGSGEEHSNIQPTSQHHANPDNSAHTQPVSLPYDGEFHAYRAMPYVGQQSLQKDLQYTNVPLPPVTAIMDPIGGLYHSENAFQNQHGPSIAPTEVRETWSPDQYSAEHLSNALGELKIDESGIGRNHSGTL